MERLCLADCICSYCLHAWKSDCLYGHCYDDLRAKEEPREKTTGEHWTLWSQCEEPGEQDHWCRGGFYRPADECEQFVQYEGVTFENCIRCNPIVYQDGDRRCPLMPCDRCISQNTKVLEERIG